MLESLFDTYGLLAILLAGFLEEIIFFIPSSVVFLAAGFLAVEPGGDFLSALLATVIKVGLVGAIGVTLGSFVVYWLVWWGGEQLIVNYGKYLGLRWRDIEKFRQWFLRWPFDEAILTAARAIPIFSNTVISAFCGLIHLPVKEFVWTTFVGSVVRVTVLALAGWAAGRQYRAIISQLESLERYLIIGIALAVLGTVLFYVLYRRQQKLKS